MTPGAQSVLERLRAADCGTAIVTNTPQQLATRLVQRAGFVASEIVGTTPTLRAKPAPDMLLHACELLGVEPAEARMVGDSSFDRDAADSAGVPFLAYRWDGGRRIEELREVLEMVRGAR